MKLTTTTGDADDDIIIADKRFLFAIVIPVCFAIGVDFKVQRLNKTDTSDLWRYDARRNGHKTEIIARRYSEPLHDLIVVQHVVEYMTADDHRGWDLAGILLDHFGHALDIRVDGRARLIPLGCRDKLLVETIVHGVDQFFLPVVCQTDDIALARGQDVSSHFVLAVDDIRLQVGKILRLQIGGAFRWSLSGVETFTKPALRDNIRIEYTARRHHRRCIGFLLNGITLHVNAFRSTHNEWRKAAGSFSELYRDLRGSGRCRHAREEGIEQEGSWRCSSLYRFHHLQGFCVINRHCFVLLISMRRRECPCREVLLRVRLRYHLLPRSLFLYESGR